MQLKISRVRDFALTGSGKAAAWAKAPWHSLKRVGKGSLSYKTRIKVLYSSTALYVLYDCEDRRLTCTHTRDGADLFTEDVVEIFLQPDPTQRLYLEYEVSPLNFELPIMVPNDGNRFFGWLPWKYENQRCVQHATQVRGGRKRAGATCRGWRAEVAIPFALMAGLGQVPPEPGMRWHGNFYRIDYDVRPESHWAWCSGPDVKFHRYQDFGTLLFA